MPSVLSQLFRRPSGDGWLILSGGTLPEDLIYRILALVDQAGILTAVAPHLKFLSQAESILQVWMDTSGREGRCVDCGSPDQLEDALAETALALLPDLADPDTYAKALGETDANEFLLTALDAGVLIAAEGFAAEALGEQILVGGGRESAPGLRWIPGAVVQSHFTQTPTMPEILKRRDRFRIGLPAGTAIALGPGEECEIWGEEKPTITFREWWKT